MRQKRVENQPTFSLNAFICAINITEVIMESTDKLTDVNQVLKYLTEKFPQCFILDGEPKPLKIGLFNDLAERLSDDPCVSKTQLRVAVRRYTNSWRYLKSIQLGTQRIDLDGHPCGELQKEHVDFASEKLKESLEKFKLKKKQQKNQSQTDRSEKEKSKPKAFVKKAAVKAEEGKNKKSTKLATRKPKKSVQTQSPDSLDQLRVEQRVKVKLGTKPILGRILDLGKDEINVQLDTGLIVKVRLEHILFS
tara:strand:+ start:1004 stop:1753 length:750 start_codon:yes stop_codon:yes gene_type:complete